MWLIIGGIILYFAYFSIIYLIAKRKGNYGYVDIAWGFGFVVYVFFATAYRFQTSDHILISQAVCFIVVILWGLRLFVHVMLRNYGKPEDFRYQNMRKKWEGKHPGLKAYVNIFLLQALLAYIVSLPITMVFISDSEKSVVTAYIGLAISLLGLTLETISDAQLGIFRKNPENRGHVMTEGLWKYSRHPNYFGETVVWWGLFIGVFLSDFGAYSLLSPLIITYLLLYVSGVPLLEKHDEGNPEYEEYKHRTSVFFPLPPKK